MGRDEIQCPLEGRGRALRSTEQERQRCDTEAGELGVWVLGGSRSSSLMSFIFSVKQATSLLAHSRVRRVSVFRKSRGSWK